MSAPGSTKARAPPCCQVRRVPSSSSALPPPPPSSRRWFLSMVLKAQVCTIFLKAQGVEFWNGGGHKLGDEAPGKSPPPDVFIQVKSGYVTIRDKSTESSQREALAFSPVSCGAALCRCKSWALKTSDVTSHRAPTTRSVIVSEPLLPHLQSGRNNTQLTGRLWILNACTVSNANHMVALMSTQRCTYEAGNILATVGALCFCQQLWIPNAAQTSGQML